MTGQSSSEGISMGEIRAALEMAALERKETRDNMRDIQRILNAIEVTMAKLATIQEEMGRRLDKIDNVIGDDKTGLAGRVTKIEGLQMLDEAEVNDLDKRVKSLEDKIENANKKFIGALSASAVALFLFALRSLGIIH
jgi:chromosome segregation ATPase